MFPDYLLLFLTALAAGFVDTIAGGGGLLTMPALLAVGLPPHLALGTNKLQSTFGSGTASLRFRGAGLVSFRKSLHGIAFTALGAAAGTLSVKRLDAAILHVLVPVLLVLVLIYALFAPRMGEEQRHKRMSELVFWVVFGLTIGFYDGFFGPGTGSFWMIALVFFLGFELKTATAFTKVVNFTSNAVALAIFAGAGLVIVPIGLLMGTGQVLGAMLGSRFVVRRHAKYIRLVFLGVVALTIVRLLANPV